MAISAIIVIIISSGICFFLGLGAGRQNRAKSEPTPQQPETGRALVHVESVLRSFFTSVDTDTSVEADSAVDGEVIILSAARDLRALPAPCLEQAA